MMRVALALGTVFSTSTNLFHPEANLFHLFMFELGDTTDLRRSVLDLPTLARKAKKFRI